MFKNMKPLPKMIIIAGIVALIGFGVNFGMNRGIVKTPKAEVAEEQKQTTISSGESLKNIIATGMVRVSVQSPSKPFFSVEHGAPQGFNVDFMKMLFAQQEFTSKLKGERTSIIIDTDHAVDTYEAVVAALNKPTKGVVDLAIDGLTFDDGEPSGIVYTIPYVEDFGYSLITSGTSMLKDVSDINAMTIGVLKGDSDVLVYVKKQFPKAQIVQLTDASETGERDWIKKAIGSGKVDGIIYDYPFAVAEIKGTDLQFAVSKLPSSNLKYKIAVRKEDTALLESLNMAIRKVKTDPAFAELIKKYFISDNTAKVVKASKAEIVYTVKKGDTLSIIAEATLGNRMRYSEIESRNNLANPHLIRVGQQLVIPKV